MRRLYWLVVRMHPAEFRNRFGDEMEWIFEEAGSAWGKSALLLDAMISLGRQWFLRPAAWKWIGASIGATVPLIFSFGSFIPWGNVWAALRACF